MKKIALLAVLVLSFFALCFVLQPGIAFAGEPTADHEITDQEVQETLLKLNQANKGNDTSVNSKADVPQTIGFKAKAVTKVVAVAAKKVGRGAGMFALCVGMGLFNLGVMLAIWGVMLGRWEMPLEGIVIGYVGYKLSQTHWVSVLDVESWVWFGMIIPGAIVFLLGFFIKEGGWKIGVLLTAPILLAIGLMISAADVVMTPLVNGNIIALLCLGFVIFILTRGGGTQTAP